MKVFCNAEFGKRWAFFSAVAMIAAAAAAWAAKYQPQIDPANFQSKIDNPYFPLVAGTRYEYLETVMGETFSRQTTVTSQTKMIMGVKCVAMHDILTAKSETKE